MDTNECSLCRPGGFALTRQMFRFAGIEIPEAGAAETESTDPAVPLRVIDIGCGAGFPGVPLKIAEPSMDLTLLDSLGKRMDWLREILPELHVEANVVTARAEEYVVSCREGFDIAVSRAVARLNILAELCLPYVKVGGVFLAMKGQLADVELEEAKKGIALLGGKVERVFEYEVADAIHRAVVIRKEKPTPPKYPRPFAKIKKSPL